MRFGEIDIPQYKIDGLCRATARAILEDLQDPEKKARLLAKAEEIKAERASRGE